MPPRQPESALGALHWTPQTPQFWGSSANTASHSLAGLRSQSAVPGEQFCKRPRAAGSAGSAGSGPSALVGSGATLALSAEIVTGTRAAQLPNPKRRLTPCRTVSRVTLFFTPLLTRERLRGLAKSCAKKLAALSYWEPV